MWSWRRSKRVLVAADCVAPNHGSTPDRRTAEQRGNLTQRHRQLLEELAAVESPTWAQRAVRACLDELRTSTLTESPHIRVDNAWTDGESAFSVVYRWDFDRAQAYGIRRAFADAATTHYVPGGFIGGLEIRTPHRNPDAIGFGKDVANFDIGEPLGNTPLRRDAAGILWWGRDPLHEVGESDQPSTAI
jgi:hypothetical protein